MTPRARTVTVAFMQPPSTFLTSLLKSMFGEALASLTGDDFIPLPAGAHTFTAAFCEQFCAPPTAARKGALAVAFLHSCARHGAGSSRRKQARASRHLEAKLFIATSFKATGDGCTGVN